MKNNLNSILTDNPEILQIIEAAKVRNYDALKQTWAGLSDKKTALSAIKILAGHRELEAIKLLMSISSYDISNFVVEGFAMSGDIDLTLEWINKGTNVHNAVKGAAEGGHEELVNLLLEDYRASIHNAAQGAAEGGHEELMNSLLARGANINFAVEGAILREDKKLLERILDRIKETINYKYILNTALITAAKHQHTEPIKWLIEEYKADPLKALNGAVYVNDFSFAKEIMITYKVMPENISPDFAEHLKIHFTEKFNIYSFLSSVTDDKSREKYIKYIAKITGINFTQLNNNTEDFIDIIELYGLSVSDAYVYYVEAKYIERGILTPLGDYVSSFYNLYNTNMLISEGENNEVFIPNEILNRIAYFCTEHPKLKHNDKSSDQQYPSLSEKGKNAVVDLWLGRIGEIFSKRTEEYIKEGSELAIMLTYEDEDNFSPVISNPVKYEYTSSFTTDRTESRETMVQYC
ncbi:hypothetical protein NF27_DP01940 [Candidatus Jidaibacter acanthamoeba]|uniref:Ankyrin repeat protein n=1 Tax=Candidatus Jidaibacter acanthamoebae TaxID=86105 RepID=A0A0C1R028_9RICK|nr:ankyrin repeat domain-containing protein [Candidatus Jidaibacter acanthamoeba]KIE05650.1 hypothetical protein NF27_DP01940 [Candidatus Jidaibacter acanthamoeba]